MPLRVTNKGVKTFLEDQKAMPLRHQLSYAMAL
jgi:hypothetical protein